jgi:hypothetical protein
MRSFRQHMSGGYVPPTPEERAELARSRAAHFEKQIAGSKMSDFDRGQYTEIGHAATTGGIGSNEDTELWVHHDDKILKKRLPSWRPHGAHHDVFGMGELNYPEGGPRKPAGRIDHALKAISLQYDSKTPSQNVERVVQQLRKAHPDYVIRDYEQNKYVHEGVAKDMAKILGAAAVAGAVSFGGGKAVKQMFPSKPEAPIAKVNHGSKPVAKPTSTLKVPQDVKAKMPEPAKVKEPEGHKEFHSRLQKHFGEEYPIIMAAAKRNGIAETDHENLSTLFAIRKAENGKQGKEFGVLHPKAKGKKGESREATLDRQAGWAAATVMSKRRSHAASGGKPEEFVSYLSTKYAPVGAENDPRGLNRHWHTNVSGWRDVFHGKKSDITEGKKHLHVFDFDDTLVKKTKSQVFVRNKKTGETRALSSGEFAQFKPEDDHELDFSGFKSVEGAEPIKGLDRAARNASRKGRDVAILTARPKEAEPAIRKYLKGRGIRGKRLKIMAVGSSNPEAKRDALAKHIEGKGYKKIEYSDDHEANVAAVGQLQQQHPSTAFRLRTVKIKEEAKPKILTRLTNQLRSKGVDNAAGIAVGKLRQFGILQKDSLELTEKGKKRNKMSPGARAKARAAKYNGGSPKDYTYNSKTNRATKKD